MRDEEETLLMIRGAISMLPADEKAQFDAAYDELKQVKQKHKEAGHLALAVLGAELAAER